jgi:hypothetical protein
MKDLLLFYSAGQQECPLWRAIHRVFSLLFDPPPRPFGLRRSNTGAFLLTLSQNDLSQISSFCVLFVLEGNLSIRSCRMEIQWWWDIVNHLIAHHQTFPIAVFIPPTAHVRIGNVLRNEGIRVVQNLIDSFVWRTEGEAVNGPKLLINVCQHITSSLHGHHKLTET